MRAFAYLIIIVLYFEKFKTRTYPETENTLVIVLTCPMPTPLSTAHCSARLQAHVQIVLVLDVPCFHAVLVPSTG